MNTISAAQNQIDLYTQSTEKIAKTLEIAKDAQQQKETQAVDSIEISQQVLQSFGNTNVANRINPLDALVNAGTITTDQATAVQNAFQSVGKAIQSSGIYNNKTIKPLDSLVTSGTITTQQETAIKGAFESSIKPKHHHSKGPATTAINPLVTAGTITQDQEDAIKNAFEAAI